jgi:colanic acid/amylovoran biosynthesis protein
MIYILSGVGTVNKGAELMLYAILQEIGQRDPKAVVYLPTALIPGGLPSIKTEMDIREFPHHQLVSAIARAHITGGLNRLGLWSDFLNEVVPVRGADYLLDASGLLFSDQVDFNKPAVRYWERLLKRYHNQGTRIVFLPQAFGPLEKPATQKVISALDRYADLIMPRDDISARYLEPLIKNPQKIHLFKDFTATVKGCVREDLKHLAGKVCIIPNNQMVKKGILSKDAYTLYLAFLADGLRANGRDAFFLDHENDAGKILTSSDLFHSYEIITGLNALEIKGIIGQSSLCITSRFHGAVSALNCAVPCLATSWSHKYQALLTDFGQDHHLLPVNDSDESLKKALKLLEEPLHSQTVQVLKEKREAVLDGIRAMWTLVWSLK